ncbi:galactitol-1-phosphate 5-dehydrogenase [Candidatus Aerophobetes bacterium Ae_b3a]|nr:MAG: galactitol-1-phosphate 5-dehydrogenase [Candidatus Aerophobetes bacterium Ae_b3a]
MKMKAAVLYGIGDLRFEEVPLPKTKKREVLVRVKACGICSSDIARVMEKGTYSFPLIPGHELSGEVANIRGDISSLKEETKSVNQNGDRVVVAPLLPCYKCPHCQIGEYNLCDDYDYLGSRCNGGFAEYVKAPQENLIKIPPGVSFEEAALTEPTSVALHALRQARIEVGDKVAILGTGTIGIILAQWARIMGASEVYLVDVVEEKLRVAQEYSFTETVNASKEDTVKSILEKTGQRGVDVSIEAAGNPITFKQSIQVVRKGGKVVFLGNIRGEVTLPDELVSSILRKELTMYGTWNSRFTELPKNEWAATLHFIKVGKLKVKPLITHRFELKQAREAFQMMYKGEEFFNKVMFVI